MDLTQLANKYKSDKGNVYFHKHHYTRIYEKIFDKIKLNKLKILEIGLSVTSNLEDCPSLNIWLEYFPNAQVYGFDIRDFSNFRKDRVTIFKGDQSNEEDLNKFITLYGNDFDIIIDDGFHSSYCQQQSLKVLFLSCLTPGGIYIIEDLHYQPIPESDGILKTKDICRLLKKKEFIECSYLPMKNILNNIDNILLEDTLSPETSFTNEDKKDAICVIYKKNIDLELGNIKKYKNINDDINIFPCYLGNIDHNNFDHIRVNSYKNIHSSELILVDFTPINSFNITKYDSRMNMIIFNKNVLLELKNNDFNFDKLRVKYAGICKICPHITGGIGNQLYIIGAAINYARQNNYKLIYNDNNISLLHIGSNVMVLDLDENIKKMFTYENSDNYYIHNENFEIPSEIPKEYPYIIIKGYYQHLYYLEGLDLIKTFGSLIKKDSNQPDITIHVRRGNAIPLAHIFHVVSEDYYKQILKKLPEGKITIVSEDLEWCKEFIGKNYKDREIIYQNKSLLEDFSTLASTTEMMILAPSTFSWWAAQLNSNKPKIIAPVRWTSDKLDINISKKYCVDGWNYQ